jgi:hypothetical protein
MLARVRGWTIPLALLALLAIANDAPAGGWLGYKNELNHTVVLQATNDKGQLGKPLVLQAGESTCDWVADTAARKIAVLDGRERPPRSEMVRFEAATTEKGDVLYVIRLTMRDNKKFIEVVRTTDKGRQRK